MKKCLPFITMLFLMSTLSACHHHRHGDGVHCPPGQAKKGTCGKCPPGQAKKGNCI